MIDTGCALESPAMRSSEAATGTRTTMPACSISTTIGPTTTTTTLVSADPTLQHLDAGHDATEGSILVESIPQETAKARTGLIQPKAKPKTAAVPMGAVVECGKVKHVVSVSGGKDSAATLLIALDACPRESIIPIFCDTGNEHEAVYQYLDYLELSLSIKITRLKADFSKQIARKRMFIARDMRTRRDENGRKVRWSNKAKRRALSVLHPTGNPFLDLCLWKGRFPSRKAQFCTEELKRNIAVEFQMNLMDAGHSVLSWQGIRRDESLNRSNAKLYERVGKRLWIFRPIVEWSASEVFTFCANKNIEPNPLYKQGQGRVGCMPCINAVKPELNQIAKRFPEHIDRIHEWELLVSMASKRQQSTFFAVNKSGADKVADIYEVISWAKTSRGGKQFNFFDELNNNSGCSSAYGLCE